MPTRRLKPILVACLACIAALGVAGNAAAAPRIAAPGMTPAFSADVRDYALNPDVCAKRFPFAVSARGGTRARIGAGRIFRGLGSRALRLAPGQAIRVLVRDGKRVRRYYVRCLPKDFPTYRFRKLRRVHTPFFVLALGHYVAIFDGNGVPVWWRRAPTEVINGSVLPNGLIAYARYYGGGYGADRRIAFELRRPDGRLVRVLRAAGSITDFHELQPTPDGNFVLVSYKPRPGVNLFPYNGDADATVLDAVVEKIGPNGKLLWSWNSRDNIALAETGHFFDTLEDEPYDILHVNSVEPLPGGDYLVSFRHADAVYRIDGESGAIEWKLGGTPTPRSLAVVNDPLGDHPFGGQHDARMLADGTVTVHDNRNQAGAPRAVRYRIEGDTATLIGSQADPAAPSSFCCGSARFSTGAWLISWGGNPLITEFFRGRRTFALRLLDEDAFSYRAAPVHDETGLAKLRRGMNLRARRAMRTRRRR